MKFTEIMKPGDYFLHQTKCGNWIFGKASKVKENGNISYFFFDPETGFETIMYKTLDEALSAIEAWGMKRTIEIGENRWKVENA